MDETKDKVSQAMEQPPAEGVEAQAEPTPETVEAEESAAAAETESEQEPENDTETEHEAAGEEPGKDQAAASSEAGKPPDGASAEGSGVPGVADDVAVKLTKATGLLLNAKYSAEATKLGMQPERIKYALRLAELDKIDPMADNADEQISERLKALLTDMPELAAGPQVGTGATGAFKRAATAPKDPFERGFTGV